MANEIPDATPEEKRAKQLANLAKARETAAANRLAQASLTEQVKAPDTVPPESEEMLALRAKAEQAETEAKALEEALSRSEALRKAAEQVKEMAHVPPPAPAQLPRNMRIERSGNVSAPSTVRWPQIRGGTCEYCGTIDQSVAAQYQYKLCGHYRGMTARCTYCPENKDPDEVTYHANLNVASHPDNPNTLIMWCNSYACSDAHIKRWSKATA